MARQLLMLIMLILALASCSDDEPNYDDTPLCERDGYVRELTPDMALIVDDDLVISQRCPEILFKPWPDGKISFRIKGNEKYIHAETAV